MSEQKKLTPFQQATVQVGKYAKSMADDKRSQQFMATMALMAQKEPKIADATPQSLMTALMACVSLDLMPNTPEQFAYVIPYNNKRNGSIEAQFQIGYKGMVELAYRTGQIKAINAELVFPQDDFEVLLGTERVLRHKPDYSIDRTKFNDITHVYATAKLANGETVFEVLPVSDLKKIKDSAKASSTASPWATWPESMAKKTAVKRLLKLLPQSAEDNRLVVAAEIDSLAEAGKLTITEDGQVGEAPALVEPELTDEQKAEVKSEAEALADKLSEGVESANV